MSTTHPQADESHPQADESRQVGRDILTGWYELPADPAAARIDAKDILARWALPASREDRRAA